MTFIFGLRQECSSNTTCKLKEKVDYLEEKIKKIENRFQHLTYSISIKKVPSEVCKKEYEFKELMARLNEIKDSMKR